MRAREGSPPPTGGGGRRRASFASRLPRLRLSSSRAGGDTSAPTSPAQAVTAPGHCERCGKPFSVLRRASICSQCSQRVCAGCLSASTVETPAAPPALPGKKPVSCAECARVGVFERQLAKAFFSTAPSTDGRRELYPGLAPACYREWFLKSCAKARCQVRATEKKRARVIRKLHDRQLLHSPRWSEPCLALHRAFATAACYVSIASDAFELIVGGCGDMLPFSCFPREIGMCDQVLGASESVLVLYDATGKGASTSEARSADSGPVGGADTLSKAQAAAAFRHNPFLVLAKAGFFAARSIVVNGVGIGVVALLDPEARATPLADEELDVLAAACAAISERVAAIIAPSRPASPRLPSTSRTAATPTSRCMLGICAAPSIR